MADSKTFVIVGGGLGGAKAAEALREKGFDGKVVLLADEEYLPYERPPLSKEFLAGKKSLSDFTVHESDWYRDNNIDLRGRYRGVVDRPQEPHRQLSRMTPLSSTTSCCWPPDRVRDGCRYQVPIPPGSTTSGSTTTRRI